MSMRDNSVEIASEQVTASVFLSGGIVWSPKFRLRDDRWVSPLAECPWADGALGDAILPPYIRRLGGAFLALPFGGRAVPPGMCDWPETRESEPLHGPAANSQWDLVDLDASAVTIGLNFPEASPIDRVEQRIVCASDTSRLDINVKVIAKRAASVPIGYHPIARLPRAPLQAEVSVSFKTGYTLPMPLSRRPTAPWRRFESLERVPSPGGGTVDLHQLPTGFKIEDLLSLCGTEGRAGLNYHDEHYTFLIEWDKALMPNCIIWVHDCAKAEKPWSNSFRGIGVEPSASAFDFAPLDGPDPLREAGERTDVRLSPDTPLSFAVSLSVRSLLSGASACADRERPPLACCE